MRNSNILKAAVCFLLFLSVLIIFTQPAEGRKVHGDRFRICGVLEVSSVEEIWGNAVIILGSSFIDGTVDGDVVSILGTQKVNSRVTGNVISIFSTTELDRRARIRGEVVSVGISFESHEYAVWDKGAMLNIDGLIASRTLTSFFRYYPFSLLTSALIAAAALVLIITFYLPERVEFMSSAVEKNLRSIIKIGLKGHLVVLLFTYYFASNITRIYSVGLPAVIILPIFIIGSIVFGFAGISLLVEKKVSSHMKSGYNQLLIILLILLFVRIVLEIPVMGSIAVLSFCVISFGVVLDTKFGSGNPWFEKIIDFCYGLLRW